MCTEYLSNPNTYTLKFYTKYSYNQPTISKQKVSILIGKVTTKLINVVIIAKSTYLLLNLYKLSSCQDRMHCNLNETLQSLLKSGRVCNPFYLFNIAHNCSIYILGT